MPRLLLAFRAEPDRVAVLQVISHGIDEGDVDRLRVPRVSRRSVADVDLRHIDPPACQSAGAGSGAYMDRSVGRHRGRGKQDPALEEGSLSLKEVLEIDRAEFLCPEERPISAGIAGE